MRLVEKRLHIIHERIDWKRYNMNTKTIIKQMLSEQHSLELFENLGSNTDRLTQRYLKNMHENFVVPYIKYLSENVFLTEAELSQEQINRLVIVAAQATQAYLPNSTKVGRLLPDAIKKKFYDELPPADAGKVSEFESKATAAVNNIKDPAAKKSAMQMIQQGMKSPMAQKMILAAIGGAAAPVAGKLGMMFAGPAGAALAGGVTGGLLAIAAAKLQGQDWKSALKSGVAGAVVGAAGGALGNMAGAAVSGALDQTQGKSDADQQSSEQPPESDTRWESSRRQLERGAAKSEADSALINDFAERMGLNGLNHNARLVGDVPVEIDRKPVPQELYTPEQLQSLRQAREFASGQALTAQQQVSTASSRENVEDFEESIFFNPKKYIDRDLTIKMWHLNETLGKPRNGFQLTNEALKDITGSIGNWLKTKGQNLTQKVTPDKLQQALKKAGNPTDSVKIHKVLQDVGVDPTIIDTLYKNMGIPAEASVDKEEKPIFQVKADVEEKPIFQVYVPRKWLDDSGNAVPEAVAKVLDQLAAGTPENKIRLPDIMAAKQALGLAVGAYENKNLIAKKYIHEENEYSNFCKKLKKARSQ